MSVNQPTGYRIPHHASLTGLSHLLAEEGRAVFRDEAARVVATVVSDLMRGPGDSASVLRALSYGQITLDDLAVSNAHNASPLFQAAEFLDLAHANTHRSAALPMPSHLDLRFQLRFYDDPLEDDPRWDYVLLATNSYRLEQAWSALDIVDAFPVTIADQPPDIPAADPGWAERGVIWDRVTRPFTHSSPITWCAPEPELLFALTASTRHPERDGRRAELGRLTIPLVVTRVHALVEDFMTTGVEALTDYLLAGEGTSVTLR